MIPYSRAKRSDLYTLSQSKLLENHTLHSGTYLYSPYMAVPPPPRGKIKTKPKSLRHWNVSNRSQQHSRDDLLCIVPIMFKNTSFRLQGRLNWNLYACLHFSFVLVLQCYFLKSYRPPPRLILNTDQLVLTIFGGRSFSRCSREI